MNFEKFFKLISFAAVFFGFLSLWVSGTFSVVESAVFLAVMIAAWLLEGSRWLISEKIGTALIVTALPASYLAYKFGFFTSYGPETVVAGILARMILALSAIKLLQNKSDRDWIFLYLMSFFEVLLAAGLSISLLYLTSFLVYLLIMVCAVIAFEMRKTSREVGVKVQSEQRTGAEAFDAKPFTLKVRKLPVTAVVLIAFIALLATPLFFMLPRVGGAGMGSYQNTLSTSTGFSDSVKLGGIGRLQQNDAVVMRVRLEGAASPENGLYFRGVALDTFDNRTWSRSKTGQKEQFVPGERDLIQLDYASGKENLLVQTIYLEPLDTPVLFSVPRTVAIQGNFPALYKDVYGAITFQQNNDRTSYKVLSDTNLPAAGTLRADNQAYSIESANYLQLPGRYDGRIAELAAAVAGPGRNRYDKALAIESYLRNSFGYTLELRSGGSEPVADFLFNVKQGHCEYFASAMAVMLRTQGIATRIVNGFHAGEYNDAAGIYVVRQRHAHAWVEVYFPKENVWVPFDPTPAAEDADPASGIFSQAGKYLEALDALWIQYFVAFDNQGQRSLARTFRTGFIDYQAKTSAYLSRGQAVASEWWKDLRGENGSVASLAASGYAAGMAAAASAIILLLFWLYRRGTHLRLWQRMLTRFRNEANVSIVDFYERMLRILAEKGIVRESYQTPLEFAWTLGSSEAVNITEKYNQVRFGERNINQADAEAIRKWLANLQEGEIAICKEI